MAENPKSEGEFEIDADLDEKAEASHAPGSLRTPAENRPYRLGLRILAFIGVSALVTLVLGSIFLMYAMGASMSAGTGSASGRTFMNALIYSYPVIILVSGALIFRKRN